MFRHVKEVHTCKQNKGFCESVFRVTHLKLIHFRGCVICKVTHMYFTHPRVNIYVEGFYMCYIDRRAH